LTVARGEKIDEFLSDREYHLKQRWRDAIVVLLGVLDVARKDEVTATAIDQLACVHCPRCAAIDRSIDRLDACLGITQAAKVRPECGIRLIEAWRILQSLTLKVLDESHQARFSRETIDLLNECTIASGALSPHLVQDAEGLVHQGYYTDTLAGQLLLALHTFVAYRSGDVLHANVSRLTGRETRQVADGARRYYRQLRKEALGLLAEQTSTRAVARKEQHAPATIRKYRKAYRARQLGKHGGAGGASSDKNLL